MIYNDISNLFRDIISTESFPKDMFDTKKNDLLKYNILNQSKKYIIELPIPGKTKNDVSITFDDYNRIKIQINKQNSNSQQISYLKHYFDSNYEETQYFKIYDDVDKTKVSAKVENGILYIILPKKQEEKTINTKIQVL